MRFLASLIILSVLLVPAPGCQLLAPVGTPQQQVQSQQQELDTLRARFGIAADIALAAVKTGAVKDAKALAVIRASFQQGNSDIKAAQANLDAGQQLTASFFLDRVRASVATLERVK